MAKPVPPQKLVVSARWTSSVAIVEMTTPISLCCFYPSRNSRGSLEMLLARLAFQPNSKSTVTGESEEEQTSGEASQRSRTPYKTRICQHFAERLVWCGLLDGNYSPTRATPEKYSRRKLTPNNMQTIHHFSNLDSRSLLYDLRIAHQISVKRSTIIYTRNGICRLGTSALVQSILARTPASRQC